MFVPEGGLLRTYRLYRLDGAGNITTAEWLEAADDAQAATRARDVAGTNRWEIWDRHRLVARIR